MSQFISSSSSVSSSSSSASMSSSRTLNTLAREGITSAKASAIIGSTFGQPGVKKTNDQQRIGMLDGTHSRSFISGSSSVVSGSTNTRSSRPTSAAVDNLESRIPVIANYLPRSQWVNLGDGWFQITAQGSGSSVRCGLHSVIESNPSELFMCIYEPRTREAYQACTAALPEYDLEVSAKLVTSRLPGSKSDPRSSFQIMFGFRSPHDYLSLSLNAGSRRWGVTRANREGGEYLLSAVPDPDIKPNVFYHILIQIRGGLVSIDINGVPVFTSLRVTDGDSLSGLVGLVAKCSKFAVKGWKIKGIASSYGGNSSSSGGTSIKSFYVSPDRLAHEDPILDDDDGASYGSSRLIDSSSSAIDNYHNRAALYRAAGSAFIPKLHDGNSAIHNTVSEDASDDDSQHKGSPSGLGAGDRANSTQDGSRRPISAAASLKTSDGPTPQKQAFMSLAEALNNVAMNSSSNGGSRPGSQGLGHGTLLGDASSATLNASANSGLSLRRPVSATLRPSTTAISPPGPISKARSQQRPPSATYSFPSHGSFSNSNGSSGNLSSRPYATEGSWMHDSSASVNSTRSTTGEFGIQRLGAPVVPIGGGGPGSAREDTGADTPTHTPSRGELGRNLRNHTLDTHERERTMQECSRRLLERHEPFVVDMVMRDVVQLDLGVTFEDIAALTVAKRLLHEAVLLPLLMPEFFTGIREPWKGVLLFGPPGTGKTLLAKAVCGFNSSTFFSCSSSSLISKYRGESEKIVRCLFEAARHCAPSVVFLDEVDALVCARGMDGEHEASRRLKTEFFAQMDGVTAGATQSKANGAGGGVMVLATTNCPWDLDEAMRRRLEKRIHIPLPGLEARKEHFKICLRDLPISVDVDTQALGVLTEGYSGADIHVACREASMMPMRRLIALMDPMEIHEMRKRGQLTIPKVTMTDFNEAIANTRPSVSQKMADKYAAWEKEFGSY